MLFDIKFLLLFHVRTVGLPPSWSFQSDHLDINSNSSTSVSSNQFKPLQETRSPKRQVSRAPLYELPILETFSSELFYSQNFPLPKAFYSPQLLFPQQSSHLRGVLRRVHLYLEQFLAEPISAQIIVKICLRLVILGQDNQGIRGRGSGPESGQGQKIS